VRISVGAFPGRALKAATLVETLVAIVISTFVIGSMIAGFVQSARQAESSSYVLAAQALASQGLEQTRAAKWDPTATPAVDQLTNGAFPNIITNLDVPGSSARLISATNITTIFMVSTNPQLKMIRVDCSWSLSTSSRVYTNSMFTYRAPDQ